MNKKSKFGIFLSKTVARSRRIYYFCKKIARGYRKTHISIYAAQCSFFMIFSALPLLMLVIMGAHEFGFINADKISEYISKITVETISKETADKITEQFVVRDFRTLSITILAVIWSASKGVGAVSEGIRYIYGAPNDDMGFFKRNALRIFYTLGFLVLIFLTLSLISFGQVFVAFIGKNTELGSAMRSVNFFGNILIIVVLALFFTLIYNLNGTKGRGFLFHLPGATLASCGWVASSFFFALYVNYFASSPNLYGSMSFIVILMLWVYICMIILLVGAKINDLLSGVRVVK